MGDRRNLGAGESEGAGDRDAREHQHARPAPDGHRRNGPERHQPPVPAAGDPRLGHEDQAGRGEVVEGGQRYDVAVRARPRHHVSQRREARRQRGQVEHRARPRSQDRRAHQGVVRPHQGSQGPVADDARDRHQGALSGARRPDVDVLPAAAEVGEREQSVARRARKRTVRP